MKADESSICLLLPGSSVRNAAVQTPEAYPTGWVGNQYVWAPSDIYRSYIPRAFILTSQNDEKTPGNASATLGRLICWRVQYMYN